MANLKKIETEKPRTLNALEIKSELIDFFLRTNKPELISSEMPFLDKSRRADLVTINNSHMTCFEIKSDSDSLIKLSAQLEDYRRIFDYVYIVITQKHLERVKRLKLGKTGLILVATDSIKILKEAELIQRHDKVLLSLLLWKDDLKSLLLLKGIKPKSSLSINELRYLAVSKISQKDIHDFAKRTILERYRRGYEFFLHDLGERTTVADVLYLSRIKS